MLQLNIDTIKKIKTLVGYKGRTVKEDEFGDKPVQVNSYWEGGDRDYWFVINIVTGSSREIRQNGTMFDRLNLFVDSLASGEVLVLKPYCRGKVSSITIYS